jgi:hypothetical protein
MRPTDVGEHILLTQLIPSKKSLAIGSHMDFKKT